jgi:hypothetical protein
MNGPQHYRIAEQLLALCSHRDDPHDDGTPYYPDDENLGNALAAAQVHATLALAAANTLLAVPLDEITDGGWFDMIGLERSS